MSGRVVWRSPPSLGGKFRCGVGGFVVVKLALCGLSLQFHGARSLRDLRIPLCGSLARRQPACPVTGLTPRPRRMCESVTKIFKYIFIYTYLYE